MQKVSFAHFIQLQSSYIHSQASSSAKEKSQIVECHLNFFNFAAACSQTRISTERGKECRVCSKSDNLSQIVRSKRIQYNQKKETKKMLKLFLLSLFFFCSSSQLFYQNQSLPTPSSGLSRSCDISGDNNLLAFGTAGKGVYMYKNNGTYFEYNQTMTNVTDDYFFSIDITADGQWLLTIAYIINTAFIYKYDYVSQQFQYFQHFPVPSWTGIAGAITDDHQLMFLGHGYGYVIVYEFNGVNFSVKETIREGSGRISHIAVTSDHSYLAFSGHSSHLTYVYIYDGSNYTHLQTIITSQKGSLQRVSITDDHEYLLIASGGSSYKGYIYEFNPSNQQFDLVNTVQFAAEIFYMSLSADKEILVITGLTITQVHQMKNNNLTQVQSMEGGYFHRLSSDNQNLLIVGNHRKVYRYCTFHSRFDLAGTDCLLCGNGSYISQDSCYNCSSDCLTCINSSTTCTSCEDGFYVNQNDECAQCMSSCYTCEDGSSCTSCVSIFQPYNCIDICGNGIVPNDGECDLEAGVEDDGCTDECQVEDGFACTMNQSTYESTCEYVGPYSLQVKSMERELFENKVTIEFYITPALFALKLFPSQYFSLVDEGYSQTFTTLSDDGLFSLTLHFKESIEGKNFTLVVNRPPFNFPEFNVKVSTSYPAYFYTDEEYAYGQFLYYFVIALTVLALLGYFLGACSSKLAGIEAMYVVQYWFLQLIWMKGDLILPLYALSAIKYSTGFNFQLSGEAFEDKFSLFNLLNTFSGNFNLSGILYLPPLIALIVVSIQLYLLKKEEGKESYLTKKIDRLEERKEKCCELTFYAVMFNYSYLLASIVLFFSQGSLIDVSSFVLIGIYVPITLAIFIVYYREVSDFKMFYISFQLGSIYYYHAGVFIIYLTIVILFTSLLSAYPWMPFIPQIFMLLFTLVKKPYIKNRDNYRSAFNILVMAVITSMSTFYFYAEETDQTWRMFVHSGVIAFLIFLILLWAYIMVIKNIYYSLTKQKEKQLVQIFYGDEEVIKRLERQILDSPILRNAPALQCEAKHYQTTKSEAERKYYRSDRKFKKKQYSEEEVQEEIKRKLEEMGLEHSEEGVQLIKDEIGILKLRKLMKQKKENVALTAEERIIFDAL